MTGVAGSVAAFAGGSIQENLDSTQAIDPVFVRTDAEGSRHVDFLVSDMHCAGCLARVEKTAGSVQGVVYARANLTTKRLAVTLDRSGSPDAVLEALLAAGRATRPFDASALTKEGSAGSELVRAMAVAGFASTNIMLLSVSVWSGAEGTTRELFHWLSALIALPAIVYSGRPFFRSAANALRNGRTNMDVPITVGVLIAAALSLYETATGGRHAWFDGSVTLLFFLLVGRVLDSRMRDVARASAARLVSLSPTTASLVLPDGRLRLTAINAIRPGDIVRIMPGARAPVDGVVVDGASDFDRSFLTGESLPEAVVAGGTIHAGAMNLTGVVDIRAAVPTSETLLAGIVRLMEAVERPDGRFVRLADRAARLYAPMVHLTALATLCGWLLLGEGIHPALTAAVAVLIITCPCALGLAVPAVQVVAAGRLLSSGVILKEGAALEKLAEVDTVVFDKTGTLTRGRPRLVEWPNLPDESWSIAAALAGASNHPLSRALASAAEARGIRPAQIDERVEHPGFGVEAWRAGERLRLGRPQWVDDTQGEARAAATAVWLRVGDAPAARFRFADELRVDTAVTVAQVKALGLDVHLLSGDVAGVVKAFAAVAGIETSRGECLPGTKVEMLERFAREGRRVLMVGDGLNDAPALAAAHVSMSPASGADITQAAAGLVFTGERLAPVLTALTMARSARRKVMQNFVLAVAYNVIAVPVAVVGLATPLIAAVAMSGSSILVVANALTLSRALRQPAWAPRLAGRTGRAAA